MHRELTTGHLVLLETSKEPIGRMLDSSKDHNSEVADVHADVPLEGDHSNPLTHDLGA